MWRLFNTDSESLTFASYNTCYRPTLTDEHVAEVATAYSANSSIFAPQLNRLYVAVSRKGRPDRTMALQIYEGQR
jgi:hypothetical protein